MVRVLGATRLPTTCDGCCTSGQACRPHGCTNDILHTEDFFLEIASILFVGWAATAGPRVPPSGDHGGLWIGKEASLLKFSNFQITQQPTSKLIMNAALDQ